MKATFRAAGRFVNFEPVRCRMTRWGSDGVDLEVAGFWDYSTYSLLRAVMRQKRVEVWADDGQGPCGFRVLSSVIQTAKIDPIRSLVFQCSAMPLDRYPVSGLADFLMTGDADYLREWERRCDAQQASCRGE